MNFHAEALDLIQHTTDCLVVGVFEDKTLTPSATLVNDACDQLLSKLCQQGDVTGKIGQSLLIPDVSALSAKRLLVVGLGKQTELSAMTFQKVLDTTAASLKSDAIKEATVALDEITVNQPQSENKHNSQWKAERLVQRLHYAFYKYDQTKSKKTPDAHLDQLTVHTNNSEDTQKGLVLGHAIGEGVNVARELGNLPANFCTPKYLSGQAQALAKQCDALEVEILGEAEMTKLGMNALLSVGKGSEEEAQLIVMNYRGARDNRKPHVLVGKGITFDSGGISIKPGAAMDEMKFDMCGAASVMGTMHSIVKLQPQMNVVAVIAAAENMPSGRATKPGDVITSMSGQTIEVLNTDAEGRLVLCDTLTYVERYEPQSVVDIATLTGACIVALGKHVSGLYSNQEPLGSELLNAGIYSNDKAWQMPLYDEYQQQLDSNFADIANIGGSPAGSVTAACFLSRFAKKYPWAHLDIAGTAWMSGAQKGATGRPVSLLVTYLLNQTEQ